MTKYNETDGVWRTVGGRKIFIRKGVSLSQAMKESGKFNNVRKNSDEKKSELDKKAEAVIDAFKNNKNEIDPRKEWEEMNKKWEESKKQQNGLTNQDKENLKRLEETIKKDQETGNTANRMKLIEDQQRYDRLYDKYKENGMSDEKIKDMLGERPNTGLEREIEKEYQQYKQAQIYPEDVEKMGKSQKEWNELDKKYSNRYQTERYNNWLKSQGIDKQLTEAEYNKMSLETEKINNKGLERGIEMEKDNLARRKKNGDSVENISNKTRNVNDMEIEKQKSDQRLAKLNKTNESLEDRVKRGIAGNQSDLVGKDREEQKAINKEYLKQSNIAREKEYKTYYEKEKLGEPSNYQKGDEIEFRSSYDNSLKGTIVREATDEEKQYQINKNLKGYIVRDNLGHDHVVADTRIKASKDWIRKAFQDYQKEHPNSKMKLADFKKNNEK